MLRGHTRSEFRGPESRVNDQRRGGLPALALAHYGKSDIFNTDQCSQFTGAAFDGVLANNDIAISLDGKESWRDNVTLRSAILQ
jgi:transposase InsO family protein